MARPQLPAACHWAGTSEAPILMFNYRIVARFQPAIDGSPAMIYMRWGPHAVSAEHRGSLTSARRYMERWIAARDGLPGQRRVMKQKSRRES